MTLDAELRSRTEDRTAVNLVRLQCGLSSRTTARHYRQQSRFCFTLLTKAEAED
jgi:hypothetical protein